MDGGIGLLRCELRWAKEGNSRLELLEIPFNGGWDTLNWEDGLDRTSILVPG